MRHRLALAAAVSVLGLSASLHGAFVAYNDCNNGGMPVGTYPPANTTRWGAIGNGYVGALKDFSTGTDLAATVSMTYVNTANGGSGPAAEFSSGTDAYAMFNGKIVNYGNAIGPNGNTTLVNTFDMVISGLDANGKYNFATTVDRGSATYDLQRWTLIALEGVDSSTYASSAGAVKISETVTSLSCYNTTRGLIASWNDIDPGDDGAFTVTFRAEAPDPLPAVYPAGASQSVNKMYGPTAFKLETVAVPEPTSLVLLGCTGVLFLRRRNR